MEELSRLHYFSIIKLLRLCACLEEMIHAYRKRISDNAQIFRRRLRSNNRNFKNRTEDPSPKLNQSALPPTPSGIGQAADYILYFILLRFIHFRNVNIALLIFACMTLCVFGTAVGVLVQGVDFGVTSILGVVSLMGIIVRNGIIMIDYAEELRKTEKLGVRDAIYHSARRRMRPIFLTSAAASMGVIPMILGGSGLWMPMGTVICYGTLITMVFLLTVLPVCYWFMFSGSTHKRIAMEKMENE